MIIKKERVGEIVMIRVKETGKREERNRKYNKGNENSLRQINSTHQKILYVFNIADYILFIK